MFIMTWTSIQYHPQHLPGLDRLAQLFGRHTGNLAAVHSRIKDLIAGHSLPQVNPIDDELLFHNAHSLKFCLVKPLSLNHN